MRANRIEESWRRKDTTKCSKGCRGKVNSYLGILTSVMPNTATVFITRPSIPNWTDHQCNPAFLKSLSLVKMVEAQFKTLN